MFQKIRGTLLGTPRIRIIVFQVLDWGTPVCIGELPYQEVRAAKWSQIPPRVFRARELRLRVEGVRCRV